MASNLPIAGANVPSVRQVTHINKPEPFLWKPTSKFVVRATFRNMYKERAHFIKEKMVSGLMAGVLSATVMVPDVAQAVEEASGGSSLKNFLLSIAAGGVVLAVILFAVIGVSNFDPVKRN